MHRAVSRRLQRRLRSATRALVSTHQFSLVVTGIIILNTLVLAMQYPNASTSYTRMLEVANLICTVVFEVCETATILESSAQITVCVVLGMPLESKPSKSCNRSVVMLESAAPSHANKYCLQHHCCNHGLCMANHL